MHPNYSETALNEAYVKANADTEAEAAIIRAVIATACMNAEETGRTQAIGSHPYFTWIAADGDDDSLIAEMSNVRWCDADGIME